MSNQSGLDVSVAPTGWGPESSPRHAGAHRPALPKPGQNGSDRRSSAQASLQRIPRMLQQMHAGDETGGEILVSVVVYIKNTSDTTKSWYAHVTIDGWCVLKTDTYEIEFQASSLWLATVPIVLRGPATHSVKVQTRVESSGEGIGLRHVGDPMLGQEATAAKSCAGLTGVATRHTSLVPGQPIHVYYAITDQRMMHGEWPAHIILNPVDPKKFKNPVFVSLQDELNLQHDIYETWSACGSALTAEVGNINTAPVLTAPRYLQTDWNDLVVHTDHLYEYMEKLYATLHLTRTSPLIEMMQTPEHHTAEIIGHYRTGPSDIAPNASEAPTSCVVARLESFAARERVPDMRLVIAKLVRVKEERFTRFTIEDIVRAGLGEREALDMHTVALAENSNLHQLETLRHRVCRKLVNGHVLQNKDNANVMTLRGLFMALNCVDNCIVQNTDYMFGLTRRRRACMHMYLLAEWYSREHVDDATQTTLNGICEEAMHLCPGPSRGSRKTEIRNQILSVRYLNELSREYEIYKKPWSASTKSNELKLQIAHTHCQKYANVPAVSLSVHSNFFASAQEANSGVQMWDLLLEGYMHMDLVPLCAYSYIRDATASMRVRIAGDSTRMDAADTATRLRICNIFRQDSPFRILAFHAVIGAQCCAEHIPEELAETGHSAHSSPSTALVPATRGFRSHLVYSDIQALCEYIQRARVLN